MSDAAHSLAERPGIEGDEHLSHARAVISSLAAVLHEIEAVLSAEHDTSSARESEPRPTKRSRQDRHPLDETACTLLADHPAWYRQSDGTTGRLIKRSTSVWHVAWKAGRPFAFTLLEGHGPPPMTRRIEPDELPDVAPALLSGSLSMLGTIVLVPTDPWDAITAAVLSRGAPGIRARHAYRRWATAHGRTYATPTGPAATVPDPDTVSRLATEDFAAAGALAHRGALHAAADAFCRNPAAWPAMPPLKLAVALARISGIGPGPAAIAATQATGDYALYPLHDSALRAGARAAAPPDLHIHREPTPFARAWRHWATPNAHRHALNAYALAHHYRGGTSATEGPDHR
ncbi:hypothetical protein [Streptomyces sp. HPF1205]|uniref:hypothetical protein n=1 Tax=Streptomyces sp. HPF1205 TaxID=2873262 RepID=UPI001CEC9C58|nr:hypothetical protein [Streptomyces sp. HPF1205]